MEFGETVKESWGIETEQAPIPHAELMTLEQLIQELDLSSEHVISHLESHGIKVINNDETIKAIAERYDMSPADIYKMIMPRRGGGHGSEFDRGQRIKANRPTRRGDGRGNSGFRNREK